MTKRIVNIMMGIVYLICVIIFYLIASDWLKVKVTRLVFCSNWALFGLSCKGIIYHGLKRTEEDKVLEDNEIVSTVASYFIYGAMSLAVVSIIYLTFFNILEGMNSAYFEWIAISLFFYVGFAIEAVHKRFLAG